MPLREAFCKIYLLTFLLQIQPSRPAVPAESSYFTQKEMNNHILIEGMLRGIDKVKTLRYDLRVSERGRGQVKSSESKIKLQCSPRKLYINIKGAEVLWLEGKNNGNALVNPNSFPFINLNLDPFGSLMLGDQHHTIYEVGYDYFKDVISYNAKKMRE